MYLTKPQILACLLLTAWLVTGFSKHTLALDTDHQQPIKITADFAERDEKLGMTTYSGAVIIEQGSLLINADKVILQTSGNDSDNKELDSIIATGQPARFQQELEDRGNFVDAKANTIRYTVNKDTIQLIEKAYLKQREHTITGDRVFYDIKAQRVRARGEVNTDAPPERVTVIIPAKQNVGQDDAEEAATETDNTEGQ